MTLADSLSIVKFLISTVTGAIFVLFFYNLLGEIKASALLWSFFWMYFIISFVLAGAGLVMDKIINKQTLRDLIKEEKFKGFNGLNSS